MHRRTFVQLSRRHAVDWPGSARLRDAGVASPRRGFHSSLAKFKASSDGSDDTANSAAPPKWGAPKFGARWAPKDTSQTPALSPEEQAIRNALLSKSPSPPNTRTQSSNSSSSRPQAGRPAPRQIPQTPDLSPEDQAIRKAFLPKSGPRPSSTPDRSPSTSSFRHQLERSVPKRTPNPASPSNTSTQSPNSTPPSAPKFGARWAPRTSSASSPLSPAEQTMRDTLISRFPSQRQEPPHTHRHRQNKNLPHGGKERQDFRPRREYEFNGNNSVPRELRSQDWTCPDCGHYCFGKHMICPVCKARRPTPRNQPSEPSRERQSYFKTRYNAARELRTTEPTEKSNGDPTAIRRVESSRKDDPDSSREAARKKHMESKDAGKELDEEDLYWGGRRSKTEKWKKTDRETDTDGYSERDKKKKGRGGQRVRESSHEDDFDPEEYHQRREQRKKLKKERAREKDVVVEAPSLYLPEFISVSNFADVIGLRPAQLIEQMEEMGFEDVTYDHVLDAEVSSLIATELGYEPIIDTGAEQDLIAAPEPEDKSIWPTRPPVVTIMGHVDHGKTTILDWLRKSSVVASEHGGITQHIGAFSVTMPSGKSITFLDTPGHAAFLDMRRRGADVTDIVVLVVAADDSVKPQTVEAIKHATSAKVPIIVAISKSDKEGIDPERVKQDLSTHGIHVEDYGGDVQAIGVSGKTGLGMLELEEAIVTLSEVLDHRADTNGAVEGWVIEGTTKSYGRVATVLVRRGTLRPGDILVAGSTWTRVRTLRNEAGVSVSEATPGTPVEIDGWREPPTAGTEMLQANDEQHAKEVVDYRREREETQKLGQDTTAINEARRALNERRRREANEAEGLNTEEGASGPKPVNFVIKADVDGSAEAVMNSVTAIGNNEVYARVLRSEVGPISESDIELAEAANGHVICFNQPIDAAMSRMAEGLGVNIMDHNIIYKLVDHVKDTLSEKLAPTVTHRVTGEAEIGQIFEISLKGRQKTSIAGCKVRNGIINRAKKVRVIRGQETVYDGSIVSLKNVKKDVTEMRKDTECGIAFDNWTSFAVGDQIQCYEEIFEKRHL
ncbi:hypothetical protein BDV18DRAFT_10758 [Aspergillus unguis]